MLFRDRLEIINPGPLPQGISVEDLYRTHDSVPRNSLIARAMSWTSYVEKSGSGTGVIIDKCTEHGLARPEFDPTSGFFKIIIWRTGSGAAKGPSRGAQSRGRVKGAESWPSQMAQSNGPVVTQSGSSRGTQSRGRVGGPSQRGRVRGAESGRMTRVERILQILAEPQCALGASQIAKALKMNSVTGRLKKIFWMLLDDRIIERTELKPNSRLQKYRLTAKGRKLVASFKTKGGRE